MAVSTGRRVDQVSCTVSVGGTDLGIWDKRSGGLIDSDSQTYRPGNMGVAYTLGAAKTVENVTVERNYKLDRDHNLVPFLKSQVGKGDGVITHQPLDSDDNAFGAPIVWTGVLKSVMLPEHDSTASDPAMIALEFVMDGEVG